MRTIITLVAVAALGCSESTSPSTEVSTPQTFEAMAKVSLATIEGALRVPGLREQVEVLRDRWGVPHIYANNVDDLFFAQGYTIAQDRLWHMEMTRRVAQGRVAEIVGAAGVPHDRLVRLLRFRGPFDDKEWSNYHPEARRIFDAYVRGINAFIAQNADRLPVEFRLTGITPEPWKADEILYRARVNAAVSSARSEIRLAQSVARLGPSEANHRARPEPHGELEVAPDLDLGIITDEVLKGLEGNLYGDFPRPELLPQYRDWPGAQMTRTEGAPERSPGSNNWAVSGALTASGKPIMVDDPHRQVTLPAWRYLVHLHAPGWNVIGATEPGLPGVIRGHNGQVAWGRTATGTDEADVFVEELNPSNAREVKWKGAWEPLQVLTETISVKGGEPLSVTLEYSRHGPIFYKDTTHHRAYALRSSLMEQGTAEYIGGLRMDQAASARDCLVNADFMRSPPTNLVCASADGAIAFRVSAAAPKRRGWNGRLPVPGTGAYEWEGLRSEDLPKELNPDRGWIATANNNIHPPGFKDPLFYNGRAPYWRYDRITQMLEEGKKAGRKFSIEDMRVMLRDSHKAEAAQLGGWFEGWTASDPDVEYARRTIASWDHVMRKDSAAAAIYMAWRNQVDLNAARTAPPSERKSLIEGALGKAMQQLATNQGGDRQAWRWGRTHTSVFKHPLIAAFDLPSVERDGGADTVNATGAVYRLITDFSDLDRSLVTIGPGISGQPGSPFYSNLLEDWTAGEFFPLAYTRPAVESVTKHRLLLQPDVATQSSR
jgi:penicillin amidase